MISQLCEVESVGVDERDRTRANRRRKTAVHHRRRVSSARILVTKAKKAHRDCRISRPLKTQAYESSVTRAAVACHRAHLPRNSD